ncbi:MAG: TetR family transcriptional regulator C-terminal domain-containing protein [Pseudomonadales bacterium]
MTKQTTGHILRIMSKREDKKDQLLELGLQVMQERGYNGSSVKDIVDAAAVPKGSFYTYFDSKEAFAVEAIDRVANANYQQARLVLGDTRNTPLARLNEFFESSAETACVGEFRVGCFMGNMCQEMADSSELIRIKVKHTLGRITDLIGEVLEEAGQKNEMSSEYDNAVTAQFLFNAWEGALMRMKAEKSREPLDAFLSMLPRILSL